MAVLVHLNGPPGVGKSTLAARWVDRHPGALDLDLDVLLQLVGGWRDPERGSQALLRPSARAMAAAHLAGGNDVVVPQYLARLEEIEAFEAVARDAGADFVEIVLLVDRAEALQRFEARPDTTTWHEHNRRTVADQGGPTFLSAMYDRLLAVVDARPSAVVIRPAEGDVGGTCDELERVVAGRRTTG